MGRSSYSTMMASAASRACCTVSATTAATTSPTKRVRSWAMARRGGLALSLPSARLKPAAPGRGLTPASTISAPVITRSTPGMAAAALVSMETMRACG